MMLSSAGFQCG